MKFRQMFLKITTCAEYRQILGENLDEIGQKLYDI
jgi:hypothetical protein